MWIAYNSENPSEYRKHYLKRHAKEYVKYCLTSSDRKITRIENVNMQEFDKWLAWAILKGKNSK